MWGILRPVQDLSHTWYPFSQVLSGWGSQTTWGRCHTQHRTQTSWGRCCRFRIQHVNKVHGPDPAHGASPMQFIWLRDQFPASHPVHGTRWVWHPCQSKISYRTALDTTNHMLLLCLFYSLIWVAASISMGVESSIHLSMLPLMKQQLLCLSKASSKLLHWTLLLCKDQLTTARSRLC